MKKFFLVLICLLFIGCEKKVDFESLSIEEKVNYKLENMTLDEKIAQMLVVYYVGSNYDDTLKSVITEVKPGGFILMENNITTYENTLNLVKSMQKDSEIPMLITIDNEGGNVQRFTNISDLEVSDVPSMYNVGLKNDKTLAYNIGKLMALELRTIGVNVDFAPVLDVFSNPNNKVIGNRSFSSDANIVSTLGLSVGKGLEDNKVMACYKHFPGHGNTDVDSHYDMPVINKSLEELYDEELIPFKNAIDNGASMIMIGHINMPKISNDDKPASLSYEIVTNLLKNELNYKGLVITDALNMGALKNTYTDKEIYVHAINAGVDLLLMPNGSRNAIKYIKEAIDSNDVKLSQIDESVKKILTYKYKYLSDNYLDKSYLNSTEHQKILEVFKED